MTEIDVVILAFTLDREVFEMNENAIRTLREGNPSVRFNVFLIESNKDFHSYGWNYDSDTQVHIPDAPFNFNAFNNHGLSLGKAAWVLFSNNDVVFAPGSIEEMLEVIKRNEQLACLCPVDPDSPFTPAGFFPEGADFVEGYHVRTTFTGWCFLVKREVFQQTGPFDEAFDYYFADDDFTMSLRMHGIRNAAVPKAQVRHLAHITSRKSSLDISAKFKADQALFHAKWGSQRWIAMKNRLTAYFLRPLGMHGIIRQIYRPKASWRH